MRIIRFLNEKGECVVAALTDEDEVYALPYSGLLALAAEAKARSTSALALVKQTIAGAKPLAAGVENLPLLVPVEAPEVWACGVTYERSRDARNYEATGGKLDATTFYDKVYEAARPEIFFKSTAARTAGPHEDMYLRSDSGWQIPEPELGLVLDADGTVLGYTIGNDLSCRDIEGENPLYLPQAKIWRKSCSIGPAIRLAEAVADPYQFQINLRIFRNGQLAVEGSASTSQLKRRFDELISYLRRDNVVFAGTVLLTGTCIVPPNEFTLADGDVVEIEIPTIGTLRNTMRST
jgi:2-dehydro-3-deoxy-D-arabinonate dehydratase